MAERLDAALLPALAVYGFAVVEGTSSGRGSSVTLANEHARIKVTADWLEGELAIEIGRVGEPLAPVASLVDLEGVSLGRLSRSVSSGQLESRLRAVGARVIEQAPSMLDAG